MSEGTVPEERLPFWLLTSAILALGVLSGASIGIFLLPVGLTLLVLGIKGRPRHAFWPPIAGVVCFYAAFWVVGYLIGPLSCKTKALNVISATCDSPLLPDRIAGHPPPFWPTILASVAIGWGAAYLARRALLPSARRNNQLLTPPSGEA